MADASPNKSIFASMFGAGGVLPSLSLFARLRLVALGVIMLLPYALLPVLFMAAVATWAVERFVIAPYAWMAAALRPAAPNSRDANEPPHVIIVGAGFSGLCAALKCLQNNIPFVLLEKSAQIGGTWQFNTYPGCACDIPSLLYEFSFFSNPNWSGLYPQQAEIFAYLRAFVEHFQLAPHIQFNTKVVSARWDEDALEWVVSVQTTRAIVGGAAGVHTVDERSERTLRAPFMISAMGGLHVPQFPKGVAGAGRSGDSGAAFRGDSFHTAEWPRAFDATGKRVAIVGSAASAVQCIPHLAKAASRLYVLQRTPNWIGPKVPVHTCSIIARTDGQSLYQSFCSQIPFGLKK